MPFPSVHFDWQHFTLPLAIIANSMGVLAIVFTWITRRKVDALIKRLSSKD